LQKKEEQEITNQEMRKRAEQGASSKALQYIATGIAQFLAQK